MGLYRGIVSWTLQSLQSVPYGLSAKTKRYSPSRPFHDRLPVTSICHVCLVCINIVHLFIYTNTRFSPMATTGFSGPGAHVESANIISRPHFVRELSRKILRLQGPEDDNSTSGCYAREADLALASVVSELCLRAWDSLGAWRRT